MSANAKQRPITLPEIKEAIEQKKNDCIALFDSLIADLDTLVAEPSEDKGD